MTEQHDLPPADDKRPARRQLLALVAFTVLLGVLNVAGIERGALRNDGWKRDAAQAAAAFTEPVSDVTGAYHVRQWSEEVRSTVEGGPAVSSRTGADERVLLAGDSVLENIADELAPMLVERTGASVDVIAERGTSLGFPELFDWEAELSEAVEAGGHTTVILLVDARPQNEDRTPITNPDDPEYFAQTVAQTGALTRAALDAGAQRVIWLERPYIADDLYESGHAIRLEALDELADADPRVSVIAAARSLTRSTGGYSKYANDNGRRVRVGDDDGVHLTPQGAEMYANAVFDELEGR